MSDEFFSFFVPPGFSIRTKGIFALKGSEEGGGD